MQSQLSTHLFWTFCIPWYMLVVDIQKFVTSMLANTDTPVMAHRPERGQKDRLRATLCRKSPRASEKHLTPLER